MIIRELRDADIQATIALWEACGLIRAWNDPAKDIYFAQQNPNSTILVGFDGQELLASVMVGQDGHRGSMYYLAVAPAHQRKGLGRQIHNAVVDWLRGQGVWKIDLLFRTGNQSVRGFYEQLGYVANSVVSRGLRVDTVGRL